MIIKVERRLNLLAPDQIGELLLDDICDLIQNLNGCPGVDCDNCIFQNTDNYEAFREFMNEEKS